MKKTIGVLLALLMVLAIVSCDGGSSISVSVDDVYPGDLVAYTDNGVSLSADGQIELEGSSLGADVLGEDLGTILTGLTGIDSSTIIPGASPVSLGLSRTVEAPTEDELDALIDDLLSGESVKETIRISNETISLGLGSGYDTVLDSGSFTMNGDLTASGKISGNETSISFSAGLVADVSIVGTDLYNAGTPSEEDPRIDIPEMVLNAATNSSISGNMVMDSVTGEPTSGTVTVSSHTAVVLGLSISDINDGTTRIPSGKYIYSIDVNESVSLDVATLEPTGSISATLYVAIYDNDDSENPVQEWEYSGTDLDSFDL